MSDDYNPFEHLTDEQKNAPTTAYIGLDDSRWDGLAVNPNFDADTYGAIPEEAPPEWPNPENTLGVAKYVWDGTNWIVNSEYVEM